MALKITSTEEKPLLARKEIKGELSFAEKATPSNDDVRKEIASQLKVGEKTVLVKHIYTAFGSSDAKIEAYIYNTEKDLKKYEPVTKAMKTKAGEGAEEGGRRG
jgi:ribosomal protein S24E